MQLQLSPQDEFAKHVFLPSWANFGSILPITVTKVSLNSQHRTCFGKQMRVQDVLDIYSTWWSSSL